MSEKTHTDELARILAGLILAQQPKTPQKFRDINLAEQIDALLRGDQSAPSQATAGPVRNRVPPLTEEAAAYTIAEFCRRYRISRSALYAQWRAGHGPRIYRIGRTARISAEAAATWIAERESEAAA